MEEHKKQREGEGEPLGPKHTYGDRPSEQRSAPDRQGAQPGAPQRPQPKPDGPSKPLPDYGDTEPGDPRRLTTSGGEGDLGGAGGVGPAEAGGPSSTVNA